MVCVCNVGDEGPGFVPSCSGGDDDVVGVDGAIRAVGGDEDRSISGGS